MRASARLTNALNILALAVILAAPAHANWLTSLTKGAGKTAGHLHPNLGALERAAGHLAELPQASKGALAAHATPEGHWQFANKEGQVFTAGTPDEMTRVAAALLPEGMPNGKLSLYLSEDSVFANSHALESLPKEAELYLVSEKGAFPLTKADGALRAQVRPNLKIAVAEKAAFDDAVNFLTKPLNKSNIRTLAIEPGEAKYLAGAPKLDSATKAPLVDAIDPASLTGAFASIRGQTALIVGRIDGDKIIFQPASGGEISRNLGEVLDAARAADVNLVILQAPTPRQPGGRNWLWQRIEIGGFSDAISKSTFADFMDALAAKRGPMQITAAGDGFGRVRLEAVSDGTAGPVESMTSKLGELVADVTGQLATNSVSAFARDEARDRELDARIIPGIPTYIQIPYLVAVCCGLLAWGVSRDWWSRLWAPRMRAENEGRMIHWLKGLPNFLAYLLVFLPVAGMPAFLWHFAVQTWISITAPFRWLAKIFRRRVEV